MLNYQRVYIYIYMYNCFGTGEHRPAWLFQPDMMLAGLFVLKDGVMVMVAVWEKTSPRELGLEAELDRQEIWSRNSQQGMNFQQRQSESSPWNCWFILVPFFLLHTRMMTIGTNIMGIRCVFICAI